MNIEISFRKAAEVLGISVVRDALEKLTNIELQRCRLKMDKVLSELIPFEKRFGKDSRSAWAEFQSGNLGDDSDIMEWMMIFENYIALEKQHHRLAGIGL
jgi:hypothetical protein